MTDQELHYSDGTSYVKSGVYWLNHLDAYGCLTSADFSGVTTYAGLRVNIVAHVPPVVHADTVHIIRQACGDGVSRPGELGRLSLAMGATLDTLIATAAADTGNEVNNLTAALLAYYSPDQGLTAEAANAFPVQV